MDINSIVNDFPNFFNYLINFSTLTNEQISVFSVQIILIAVVFFIISIILFFIFNRKSREEVEAINLLKKVENLRKKNVSGEIQLQKTKEVSKGVSKEVNSNEKKSSISLKEILIKKFKPKIESQLQTPVNIIDFKSKANDFEVLVEINSIKLVLIIDNGGKIIDYKRQE